MALLNLLNSPVIKGGLSPREQELPSGAPPCHRNVSVATGAMARDAVPRLGREASAASDPAVDVAVLRFRERAKYRSLERDHRRRYHG